MFLVHPVEVLPCTATVGGVNLVTFLLTRISEDEQAARALKPPYALFLAALVVVVLLRGGLR